MIYLDLEEIKKQCIIDEDFIEDDAYLESLGDVAERLVNDHVDGQLDDIVADNSGELPATLKHSMLMIVDYLYDYRGSNENKDVPEAFFVMCKPYIKYNIG